jgi:hypothetical protein
MLVKAVLVKAGGRNCEKEERKRLATNLSKMADTCPDIYIFNIYSLFF